MNLQKLSAAKSILPILMVAVSLMTGCAPMTYRNAFYDYSEVYADGQNHQMLLNLARLSQHDPPYFFQSGNIQANYTFTGNFSAQAQQSAGSAVLRPYNWLWNSLQVQGTRTSQPTFNFVPLVGGDFAAHLITPIRPEMFDAFFEAGYPVDILLRSMVQQVQFTAGTDSDVLNNVPTTNNIDGYIRFLRLCDMLRDLQERGYLMLLSRQADTNGYQPIAQFPKPVDPKEILDSTAQGYHWTEAATNEWRVDREVRGTNTLAFQLTPPGVKYLEDKINADKPELPYVNPGQVKNLLAVLSPDSKIPPAKVQLRSFLFTLQNMATEQAAFVQLTNQYANFTNMVAQVPQRQLRPVLQIVWSKNKVKVSRPLISVFYQYQWYRITDAKQEWADGYNSYNRDAFMLCCTLFSQISLDPTTLNYQQQYLLSR